MIKEPPLIAPYFRPCELGARRGPWMCSLTRVTSMTTHLTTTATKTLTQWDVDLAGQTQALRMKLVPNTGYLLTWEIMLTSSYDAIM